MHPRNVSKQRQLQSAAIQELAKKRAQQLAAKSNQPSVEQDDHASRQPSDRFNMSDMSNALPHASNDDDLRTLLTTVATTPLPDDDGGANDNVGGQPANSSTADQPKKPSTNASDLVVGPFYLEGSVAGTLYSHQHEGVRWLCSLHALKKGGILADDMGLGKTMQCAAFLRGLYDSKLMRRALVVAPKTVLAAWAKELRVVGLTSCVYEFVSSPAEREVALRQVYNKGGILLTTYGMVLHNAIQLQVCPRSWRRDEQETDDEVDGHRRLWDVMFLDEGHTLKNPKTQIYQHISSIPAMLRIVITGTPINNNLSELYALFALCNQGLLGDARWFRDYFEKPITHGQDRHATPRDAHHSNAKAAELRKLIGPYFLRREKNKVLQGKQDKGKKDGDAEPQDTTSQQPKPQMLGRKNDLIVWLELHPLQRAVYEAFLLSPPVKQVLNETGSALAAITVLKKVCDHPALLSNKATATLLRTVQHAVVQRRLERDAQSDSDMDEEEQPAVQDDTQDEAMAGADALAAVWLAGGNNVRQTLMDGLRSTGIDASCKTSFVVALLRLLVPKGHKVLLFSQNTRMLDILQAAVEQEGYQWLRIDGSVTSAAEREARVQRFQNDPTVSVFLLTTGVGGVGLTLTAADRVIIVDPAWNPQVDNQSVDRAYRIGQEKDVVVYRLITCGTVEEKMYRKQVYKGGLARTGTEAGVQFRYFTQQELRDLFVLKPEHVAKSVTAEQLNALHAGQRNASTDTDAHIAVLEQLGDCRAVSDHDLLFTQRLVEEERALGQPTTAGTHWMAKRSAMGFDLTGLGMQLGAQLSLKDSVQQPPASSTQIPDRIAAKRVELEAECTRLQNTLRTMGAKLPDQGARVRHRLHAIQVELDKLKDALPSQAGKQLTKDIPREVVDLCSSSSDGDTHGEAGAQGTTTSAPSETSSKPSAQHGLFDMSAAALAVTVMDRHGQPITTLDDIKTQKHPDELELDYRHWKRLLFEEGQSVQRRLDDGAALDDDDLAVYDKLAALRQHVKVQLLAAVKVQHSNTPNST